MNSLCKHNNNHKIDEMPPPTTAVVPPLNLQTPARRVNSGRRSLHTADEPGNPHVVTPPNETNSAKKKRYSRIRAYNSRLRTQSELWCIFRLFKNQICFYFHFLSFHHRTVQVPRATRMLYPTHSNRRLRRLLRMLC
jgi:hypothetical protein